MCLWQLKMTYYHFVRSHVVQNVFDLFIQMLGKYKGQKKKENRRALWRVLYVLFSG